MFRTYQQYLESKPPQSDKCETLALGKCFVIASGTCPPNAGKIGTMPSERIRSRILCCSTTCWVCHDWGIGPPQPCMLPIRYLEIDKLLQSSHNDDHIGKYTKRRMFQLTHLYQARKAGPEKSPSISLCIKPMLRKTWHNTNRSNNYLVPETAPNLPSTAVYG